MIIGNSSEYSLSCNHNYSCLYPQCIPITGSVWFITNPVQYSTNWTLNQNKIALKFSGNKNWTVLPFKPLELNHTCYGVIQSVEQDEFDNLMQIHIILRCIRPLMRVACCLLCISYLLGKYQMDFGASYYELWGMSNCVSLHHCMMMAVPFNLRQL